MKIPPQTFFNFCAGHVQLLQGLAGLHSEISEADARRLFRSHGDDDHELPETTWRRLRELQILVPLEIGSDYYFLAEPVRRILSYIFDEAQAATPEIIRGYIQSLETLGKQLARAIDDDDIAIVRVSLEELQQTLRRVQSDLDETHRSISAEITRYKSERQTVSVRDKFRRIVHWMDRYVAPVVEIVRVDGPLRATFDETERLLYRAREHGLFNDLPALERNTRHLRLVARHALRVFQQCRRELQPLYDSLRRSSFIAQGAAIAIERLQREGPNGWAERHTVASYATLWKHAPSDAAIDRAVRNVVEYRPEPAPIFPLHPDDAAPTDYLRHRWLEDLAEEVRLALPLPDLLAWMVDRHPHKSTADALAGLSRLVFDTRFCARFTDSAIRSYQTTDGALSASPVELTFT